jgi:hypothetical protein
MNVVDDKETNTWAIEFGGLINAKFVNINKCETIEEGYLVRKDNASGSFIHKRDPTHR